MMKLYMDMLSQPCRALAILVQMNNIPCTIIPIAIRKGDNKSEEFLKLNPVGKVPVLVDTDNDFILTESIAIFRYVSRKHPNALYPDGAVDQAKVDEYLSWQHMNTRMKASAVFITEVFKSKMFGMGLDAALSQCESMLDDLHTMFIKDKQFILGDTLSFADVLCVCELMQPGLSGRNILKGRPDIEAYVQRVKDATNPHFDEAHAAYYKVQNNLKKRSKM